MSRRRKNNSLKYIISLIVILCLSIAGYLNIQPNTISTAGTSNLVYENSFDLSTIPEFNSSSYVILNNNVPEFKDEDFTTTSFEKYSKLDSLGRCGVAYACLGMETMPSANDERENISNVEPSGWINKKYKNVDGGYLYNRCHLIGYQLSNENDNEKNLITGTRYMNTEGMLPFENQVADYIKETKNHVLYRVTPIYDENNLVASGVQMEAKSVEDNGKGICFNVYCYNSQPGIEIDYETGESHLASSFIKFYTL